ncbi:BasR [Neisseria gonorrhoeae PID1]|nr:BasR [Neisseria gonorrhoeae PID1]
MSASLKDGGYAVDWVKNGAQVAAAAAAQPYDLMLLDLGLPGRDGLDVLSEIRAAGCTVPVLIVTARDDLYSRLNGLDGGADDYIVKPFDMAEFKARMRAVLRRGSGQAQACLSNGALSLNPATYQVEIIAEGRGGIEQPGVFGIAGFAGEAGCDFVALGFGGQGLRLGRGSRKQCGGFSDSRAVQEIG